MASRRRAAPRTAPGGIAGTGPGASRADATTTIRYAHIEAVIEGGGQILLGTVAPIHGAAVAHDGKKTLAMLRRRPDEPVAELLARLDGAIATAIATGQRVDEVNTAAPGKRYEL